MDFHWLFHLTVHLAAPHVSLLIHILILYLSPKPWRYSSSFFPHTAILWNSLPVSCFPATYNLSQFKRNINSHLSTFWFPLLLSPLPLFSPHLEWPVKALWLATTHKQILKTTMHYLPYSGVFIKLNATLVGEAPFKKQVCNLSADQLISVFLF